MQEGGTPIFSNPAEAPAPAPMAPISSPEPVYAYAPEKKSKKKLIIIALAVIVVLASVALILFFMTKRNSDVPNLRAIFDSSALIPAELEDGKYGYISPTSGDVVIGAKYAYAERFYGNYAIVSTENQRGYKLQIIDKSGKVMLEAGDGNTDSVEYIVDQSIWKVGAAFYDEKMKRITPENESAKYLGSGYIKTDSRNAKILNREGKVIFSCPEMSCDIDMGSDFNSNGEFYAIVQYENMESTIVDLKSGKVVTKLSPETSEYFTAEGNNIFAVRRAGDGAIQKQFFVYGGEINKEFDAKAYFGLLVSGSNVIVVSTQNDKGDIKTEYYDVDSGTSHNDMQSQWNGYKEYPSSEYIVLYCGDVGMYGLSRNGTEVLPCEYDRIVALPKNVFNYYRLVKKQDLFMLFGDEAQLYDVAKKDSVRVFSDQGLISDVRFYENSPFYMINDDKLYSLSDQSSEGISTKSYTEVDCYGNYFVLDNEAVYGVNFDLLSSRASS